MVPLSQLLAGALLADEGMLLVLDEQFLSMTEPIKLSDRSYRNFPFRWLHGSLLRFLAAGDCTVFKPSSDHLLCQFRICTSVQTLIPAGRRNGFGQVRPVDPGQSRFVTAFTGLEMAASLYPAANCKHLGRPQLGSGRRSPDPSCSRQRRCLRICRRVRG